MKIFVLVNVSHFEYYKTNAFHKVINFYINYKLREIKLK